MIPASKVGQDESVASFIRRRFGQEALERVGQPMIAGVYSGDPEELSILYTMPRFKELEAAHGSVIRGLQMRSGKEGKMLGQTSGPRYSLFMSFARGMGTLTDALVNRIQASSLFLGYGIASVHRDALSKRWRILSGGGDRIEADAICFATPARVTAGFLKAVSDIGRQIINLDCRGFTQRNTDFFFSIRQLSFKKNVGRKDR